MFLRTDAKDSDPDLSILKNRTEELLALPHFFLRTFSLSDINNCDNGPGNLSIFENWERGIFNRDRGAVTPPQDLIVHAAALPLIECTVDGTFLHRIRGAVQLVVMDQIVHIAAQCLLRAVADQFTGGPIDECAVSLQIDTINALAGR